MITDIFGAVVPQSVDLIYSIFFPAGFNTFMSIILIIPVYITYLLSVRSYRHSLQVDRKISKQVGLQLGFIFGIGIFIPLLLGFFLEYLVATSIYHGFDVIKFNKENEKKSGKTSISIYILLIFEFLFLILFSVSGFILTLLLGWWAISWMFMIGANCGLITVFIKKPKTLLLYNKHWRPSSKVKLALRTAIIIVPILFGSVFIFSNLPKIHGAAPDTSTSPEPTSLNIMTYNIRYGTGIEKDLKNQWFNRKEEFVEYLDGFDLDVFGIQEALIFQIQYIKDNVQGRNYAWTGKGRSDGLHAGEACPIFFDGDKYEFIDGDTFWLSNNSYIPSNTFNGGHFRVCTWARLEVKTGVSKGAQFCVFNTHYDFADEWQVKASHVIAQKIKEHSGGLPTILMGDFNLRNYSIAFPILENYEDPGEMRPMRDAYRVYMEDKLGYLPYATTSPIDWDVRKDSMEKSRIDLIFISEGINVNNISIPKDYYGDYRTYSDHYPVLMECTF